jgi:hypothetical protein
VRGIDFYARTSRLLAGTTLDRFGIITSWIDGNSQDVSWDDIASTVAQE